jgi:hypothetical protein
VDAHAPALIGLRDFAPERLREHLMAEAHADERFLGYVQAADVFLESFDPVAIFVNRMARAGADIRVTRVRRAGQLAVSRVEPHELRAGEVRREQALEHRAVGSCERLEALRNVVAAQQTNLHRAFSLMTE